jgi:glycosyltransferase involved in cell wall biosynthesis
MWPGFGCRPRLVTVGCTSWGWPIRRCSRRRCCWPARLACGVRPRFDRGKDLLYWAVCVLERITCRLADIVNATNESYRFAALTGGRKAPDQAFVVRSAPDLTRFPPSEPDPALKQGKPHMLCYLGVMGPQDGVDCALRALASLRDDVGRTDWHAVFVGAGDAYDDMVALAACSGCSATW